MADALEIHDNVEAKRFEVTVDGRLAMLVYERTPDTLVLIHTEVPPALRGHHLGDALITFALAAGRREGRRIVPLCPFVRAYLQKHPLEE